MDYQELYQKKLGTLHDALQLVQSGDVIAGGMEVHCARDFAMNLHTQAERLENVKFFTDRNFAHYATLEGMGSHIEAISFFYGRDLVVGNALGNCSFFPSDLANYASTIVQNYKIDMFVVATSAMDENGNFEIGFGNVWEGEILRQVLANHARIVVEENPNFPHVEGATTINIQDVTCVVPVEYEMKTIPGSTPTEDELKVAQNVRSLLRDGDCIQAGIGSLPDAIMSQCMDLQDLGLHTEMLTTGLGRMIKAGVITGARKNLNTGEHVYAFAAGEPELYEIIRDTKACRVVPGSYGVNPMVIAQNDNMVSVNTLIEMDLTGQICAESIGPKQFSGSGGSFDFAYGAMMSKGGRGIMAFTAKTNKGYSKIKATLTPGAVVTVPRNYADYVVTEYGIAPLRGRSVRERVNNLIAVAHPDVREELRAEARKLMYI